jgi:hypothetical protein
VASDEVAEVTEQNTSINQEVEEITAEQSDEK